VKAYLLAANLSDFLCIDDISVEAGQEEAAPHALRAMLLELQEGRGWALAAFYLCVPRSMGRACSEAEYARLLGLNRLVAVRAGLVQVDDGPVYCAAPQQAEAPVLPRAQALAVAEQRPPEPQAKSPEDEELFQFAMESIREAGQLGDKDLARVKAG
jgi:hypothetical protein